MIVVALLFPPELLHAIAIPRSSNAHVTEAAALLRLMRNLGVILTQARAQPANPSVVFPK
jgi:hypothetical protein